MREAKIHVPDTELEDTGLAAFVALCRDHGVRSISELACHDDGCLFVLTLNRPPAEEDFAAIESIQYWDRLAGPDDTAVYLCKVVTTVDTDFDTDAVSTPEIGVDDDGFDVSLVGPQDALAENIDHYEDNGVSVALQAMSDYTGPDDTLDAVTERQRQILETAYDLGYFEVPRDVSAAAVADELELDPSTVTEHLQRAQRNILGELLATAQSG